MEEIHRVEIRMHLARRGRPRRPERERELEQASDQRVGSLLQRSALAAREATELETDEAPGLGERQCRHKGDIGRSRHIPDACRRETMRRRMITVPNDAIREHAERLLAAPVDRGALALRFSESTAASVEVLVEGASFYPRMLEDIASASSSIHINQFGFRPGVVGDEFADALIAKADEGVPVRLVVDRQGSDPERSSRQFYERLTAAGIQVCVVRATKARAPVGTLGSTGATGWNLAGLGHIDHRKLFVVDGRIGWVGGAGIEDHFQDGRFHDLFVRVDGPVVAQLQLVFVASFRWLGGELPVAELDALFPSLDAGAEPDSRGRAAQRPRELSPDHRRDRAAARRRARDARRRQSLRHRPPDDPPDRGCCPPRRPGPPLRPREREQLGLRRRAAVPPCEAARRGRPDPGVPDDAAREGVRPRRRGAPGGHLQPRGLEPEALLRDRPPAPWARGRGAVRRAVQRAGRGGVVARAAAHRNP